MGLFKKSDGDEDSSRRALFGSRKKDKSPSTTANPYAKPIPVDPYTKAKIGAGVAPLPADHPAANGGSSQSPHSIPPTTSTPPTNTETKVATAVIDSADLAQALDPRLPARARGMETVATEVWVAAIPMTPRLQTPLATSCSAAPTRTRTGHRTTRPVHHRHIPRVKMAKMVKVRTTTVVAATNTAWRPSRIAS